MRVAVPAVPWLITALMCAAGSTIASAAPWTAQATQSAPSVSCREWHECEQMALDAYAQHDYERFHDLAWRAVQTGPAKNTDLMYLLARAQSRSGRPHDALVMLERLAEMGVATDAKTNGDFEAVRQLRQWPEFEAMLSPPTAVAAATPATTAREPAKDPSAVAPAPEATPRPPDVASPAPPPLRRHAEEALRIPQTGFAPSGLAYDRVSSRFVVADRDAHKLMIIDERSRHVIDLVTAASAGFYEITGFEIDPLRGDLWVVTAEAQPTADGGQAAAALHKLQLVSGRPLDRFPAPTDVQPCRFADVGILPDGNVLVLDAAEARLFRFRPSTRAFTAVATLHVDAPTSVAIAGERTAYVAHAAGISRVDIATGAVSPVASPNGTELTGFTRIRWAHDSLVGVQRSADGSQRAVRMSVGASRVTGVDVIDNDMSPTDNLVSTVSGDDFYFLVQQPTGDSNDIVIRHRRLR